MKDKIKKFLRHLLIQLELPVTQNIRYDILTGKILKKVLRPDSNCIDVGAHKGEILDEFISLCPGGKHFAFEPIPYLFNDLKRKYPSVDVYPFALAENAGTTEFNLVLDDPAYSGLKERKYKVANARINKLKVEVRRLDEVMGNTNISIDLIKIDVEGGELGVLKGASQLLQKNNPLIIFECGKGASEFYGTQPEDVFTFLNDLGYDIYLLGDFYRKGSSMTMADFVRSFHEQTDYYFVAEHKSAH